MTETTTTTGKAPTHAAYQVIDRGEGKKAIWNRVGSAWTHSDQKGLGISLDSIPLDGRLSIRVIEEKRS